MDYSRAYNSEFTLRQVNPETWRDTGDALPISGVSISYSATDSVPLIQAATLDVDTPLEDGWYRVYMVATQRDREKTAIGTFLFRTNSAGHDYGYTSVTAKGDSVLKPADLCYTLGDYAPAGSDGAQYAAQLLRECTPAPVVVEGSFTLSQPVVFQPGTSKLKAVWMLLDAGGFCMFISGSGAITITQKPEEAAFDLDRMGENMLLPGVNEDYTANMPNRYIAVQNGNIGTAENRDGDNPLSYKTRGYWVEVYDKSVVRVNGETLAAYAERKLREASVMVRKVSYTREFIEGVGAFSVVFGSIPEIGLDGFGRVASGQMECGHGITVSETAIFQENLWTD